MIAVDTNVLAYFWLKSDKTSVVEKIHSCDPVWIAPFLWRSEFRNVVSLYMRRGLSLEIALESIENAENQMNGREYQVNSAAVMRLAQASGCSAHDCEFVHIAEVESVPLVTFDTQIVKRFPHVAVDPMNFLERFK